MHWYVFYQHFERAFVNALDNENVQFPMHTMSTLVCVFEFFNFTINYTLAVRSG